MKLPRDINGEKLAELLKRYGYETTRQTGSHMRLTTKLKGEHHITIPRYGSLKVGTLNSILRDVAEHIEKTKEQITKELFRK